MGVVNDLSDASMNVGFNCCFTVTKNFHKNVLHPLALLQKNRTQSFSLIFFSFDKKIKVRQKICMSGKTGKSGNPPACHTICGELRMTLPLRPPGVHAFSLTHSEAGWVFGALVAELVKITQL